MTDKRRTYQIQFKLSDGTTKSIEFDVNDGISAYEYAIENGYQGTEKEWYDTLAQLTESSKKAEQAKVEAERASNEAKAHTAALITEWLDQHPEATTTVMDGSITDKKIEASFLSRIKNGYVTPEMFGAVGDNKTDDSDAIQQAFDSGKLVLFEHAEYAVAKPLTITKRYTYILGRQTLIRYIGTEPCSIISIKKTDAVNTAEKSFIKGLWVRCDNNNPNKESIKGIELNGCHGVELNAVSVHYCGYAFFAGTTSHLFYARFVGCHANNTTHGFTFPHGTNGQKNDILYLQCKASTSIDPKPTEGYGYLIGGTAISMHNCTAEATYRGIELDGTFCNGCDIGGSYFEGNIDCDVYIPDGVINNINIGTSYTKGGKAVVLNNANRFDRNIRVFSEDKQPIVEQRRISCVDEAQFALSKVNGLTLPATVHVNGTIAKPWYIFAGVLVNGKLYQVGSMNNVSYKILSIENGVLTFDGTLDKDYTYWCAVTKSNPSYTWLESGAKSKVICTSEDELTAYAVNRSTSAGATSITVTDAELTKTGVAVGDYVTFLDSPQYIIGTVAANTETQTIKLNKPTALQGEVGIVARSAWARQEKSVISLYGVSEGHLPDVSAADNGSFLRVVDGIWATATVPNAEEASF